MSMRRTRVDIPIGCSHEGSVAVTAGIGGGGLGGFGDESVAYATDGEEMDGFGGIGFKVAAEANDEVVDGAGVGVFFDMPDVFKEFRTGDDLAGVVEQVA